MVIKQFMCSECQTKVSGRGFDYRVPYKCDCENSKRSRWIFWKYELTEVEKEDFLAILQEPNLFNLITETELDKKIVGEMASRKVIFLSACGRLVKNCQTASYNLLVNDEAGTGKDYITARTLAMIPKEQYIHKTRISPAVFTYWHNKQYEPEWSWNGKVFYPEDISETVLNSDVFKVMCSSGSSATIVIKQKAVDIEIEGKPVMITTTATATPNPELTRRFSILNLDGSENQTKEIMKRHSEYARKGIIPEYNNNLINAQLLLEPVNVVIPFTDGIEEHFPSKNIIMRTLYPRFLDYIKSSAAFHQFQRKKEGDFILAEGQDYNLARECFLKLCSNKYMIPLTKTQKIILSLFESEPSLQLPASQLLPMMKGEVKSLVTMQEQLRRLCKYGILSDSVEKDSLNRDMEVFSLSKGYKPNEKLEIPTYEELIKLTKSPKLIEITKITKITNEEENHKGDTLVTSVILGENAINTCSMCKQSQAIIILGNGSQVCKECAYK